MRCADPESGKTLCGIVMCSYQVRVFFFNVDMISNPA